MVVSQVALGACFGTLLTSVYVIQLMPEANSTTCTGVEFSGNRCEVGTFKCYAEW